MTFSVFRQYFLGKSSVSELHFFLNITTVIDNIIIKKGINYLLSKGKRNCGTFAPESESYILWNFRFLELSLLSTFAPRSESSKNFCSLELSLPRTKVTDWPVI